jgi:hypothetical protein
LPILEKEAEAFIKANNTSTFSKSIMTKREKLSKRTASLHE